MSQRDFAGLIGVLDRAVRRWEAGAAAAPPEVREVLVQMRERRDTIARGWVVEGGPITIPADRDGLPAAVWWSAAGRALEVLDVPVVTERTPGAEDRRRESRGTLTLDQVEHAEQLRGGRRTLREIGAELGVDESTVRRVLGPDGTRTGPREVVDVEHVLHLHKAGMTQAGIAKQLGVSRGAVRRRLAEAGVISWSSIRRPAYRSGAG